MESILNFTHSKLMRLGVLLAIVVCGSCNSDDDGTMEASSVHMKTLPKVAYVLGEELDLSDMVISIERDGGVVDIPFSSFASENITVDPPHGTVLDFSHEQVNISIGESGAGLIQPISVTNDVVELEVKTQAMADYVAGQKLDLSDMVVTLIMEDGSKADVAFEDFGTEIETAPMNGDVLSVDHSEVRVTYISTLAKVAQEIEVVPFSPVSGTVVNPPVKSEYEIGERLELDGTVLSFSMADGQEVTVAFEDFGAFGLTASPANEIKLKATETQVEISHPEGVAVVVPITVNTLVVAGMAIETKPEKTLYEEGETIDLKGLSLRLSFDDKEDLIVPSEDFDIYGIVSTPAQGEAYVAGTSEIEIAYPDFSETVAIPLGSEIIYESDFSGGEDGWGANQNGGGSVNYYAEEGILIAKDIVVGANPWDVQLFKSSITLEEGGKYKLTTVVKAYPGQGDFWFSLSVGDGTGRDGWQAYDGGGGIWLAGDTEYQTYEKEFVMGQATTNGARILFDIGNQTNGIMVQYVKLEKL
ncbi:carbohydrate binding domain-containing protein [Pseudozobellia thermophila]|uniref:Carbohydrate binding domain-containing protein n=1 Tax=Pseudozobellia thermophila TaxID=192903 RepID=A0A1M6FTP0_9FLAO|nr:carbohydrate binding domain-containing protein [Pseudozobellia thermophila]SHJ00979.1 Carbohydrate binding domain-containing protein [Pseudozobellia thermophila]